MILATGKDELVAEWIARRIPYMRGASLGPCTAFHVKDDHGERILGAVAFHGYRPEFRAIEWTAAADTARWLSPKIINTIMRYPFEQLGCRRITALIAESNHRSRDFQERFGFKREGRLRRFINAREDMLIFGLLASDWKKSDFNLQRTNNVAKPAELTASVQ
jgi:RimJ/RimL family protein N-acetyltransferase